MVLVDGAAAHLIGYAAMRMMIAAMMLLAAAGPSEAMDKRAAHRVVRQIQYAAIAAGKCPGFQLSDERLKEANFLAAAYLDYDTDGLLQMMAWEKPSSVAFGKEFFSVGGAAACNVMWKEFGDKGTGIPGLLTRAPSPQTQ